MITTRGLGAGNLVSSGLGFTETLTVISELTLGVYLVRHECRLNNIPFDSRVFTAAFDGRTFYAFNEGRSYYVDRTTRKEVLGGIQFDVVNPLDTRADPNQEQRHFVEYQDRMKVFGRLSRTSIIEETRNFHVKKGEIVSKNYIKDPSDKAFFEFVWTDFLDGDTITTSTFSVDSTDIVIDSDENTTTTAKAKLSLGKAGADYLLSNQIVTASGQEFERSMTIKVVDL